MSHLSHRQRRLLLAIAAGWAAAEHCRSVSDYGGLAVTLTSLMRLGLVDWKTGRLTKAGRLAARELRDSE